MDKSLEEFINNYKDQVDQKYNAVVTRFSEKLTHLKREEESTLGNMVADALADTAESEVILIGSGSIRGEELGPVVTLGTLKACFPYDDNLTKYKISGKELKNIFSHIMRMENRDGEGECFQVNSRLRALYSEEESKLISINVDGHPVADDQIYTITLQGYHIANSEANLNMTNDELIARGSPKVVTTSTYQVLEEWLRHHPNITRKIEGRLIFGK